MDKWIMKCITTTSFRLIANGRTGYSFQPKRGIRQGAHSHHISLQYIPSLGRILIACLRKFWYSIKLNIEISNILELIFTDDCTIFSGQLTSWKNVKQILEHNCKVSGQLVNYYKSKIKFSKSMNNADKGKNRYPTNKFFQILPTLLGHTWDAETLMKKKKKRTKLEFKDIK